MISVGRIYEDEAYHQFTININGQEIDLTTAEAAKLSEQLSQLLQDEEKTAS